MNLTVPLAKYAPHGNPDWDFIMLLIVVLILIIGALQ